MSGTKHDSGKLRWDLLPWDAAEEVVKILTFGAKKYDDRNWEKGISYSRLFAALQRHLTAWFQYRIERDTESGLHHLAHAACCLMFLLALSIRQRNDLDDRPEISEV